MSNNKETRHTTTDENMARRIVLVIAGIIQTLLGFRFFFKLIGANASNVFVKGIYSVTQFFVGIFEGIFSTATTTGAETEAIFEPATLIAMIVVALIAWAIMKLMPTSSTSQVQRSNVNTGNNNVNQNVPNDYQSNQVRNTDENPVNQDATTNNPNQTQHNQVRNSDGTVVNQEVDPDNQNRNQ